MPPSHIERPSSAAKPGASCLPAPARGRRVDTRSEQARYLAKCLQFYRSVLRAYGPDSAPARNWRDQCVKEAGYIISGAYCTAGRWDVPA